MPDTSCMIAASCAWHEHHDPAAAEIEQRLQRGDAMSIAGPALIEAYAVLTRLPLPHRLNAQDAVTLLEENFIKRARTVVLNAHAYHMLVRQAPEKGIAGGQTYDAVVSACAAKAQVDTVLTFDHRHFESLVDPSIELIIPGWKNA